MKEKRVYVTYVGLTPGLENIYHDFTHDAIVNCLREHFDSWQGFFSKYDNYSLGFYVVTKKGIAVLETKGPSISKKMQIADFSIFLPEIIDNQDHYIDLVFQGISIILLKYNVSIDEVMSIKLECKKELSGQ